MNELGWFLIADLLGCLLIVLLLTALAGPKPPAEPGDNRHPARKNGGLSHYALR